MYKLQKPLTVTSGILSVILTALVLFIASSANAQTEDSAVEDQMQTTTSTEVASSTESNRQSEQATANSNTATSTDTKTSLQEKRAAWQQQLTNRQASLEQKRAEMASTTMSRQAALNQSAVTQITAALENARENFSEASLRLSNIINDLRNQLDDLENSGANISAAQTNLTQAETLIVDANQHLQDVEINVQYFITSPTPKADWQDVRLQIVTSRDILKETKRLIRESIQIARSGLPALNNSNQE